MAAPTFSYAQAAKGMSTSVAPTTSSKPSSGSATPAKDATSTPPTMTIASVKSWADDTDEPQTEQVPTQTQSSSSTSKHNVAPRPEPASIVSSPELGALSSSTVTKDDDVSSIPNASSESTWENKSQASTSVDKSIEPAEKTSEEVKKAKNGDRTAYKPLQEAPPPSVNIWKMRAEEQAKVRPQKPATATSGTSVPQGPAGAGSKKNKVESAGKGDDKAGQPRRDGRTDTDTKKGNKSRPYEKDVKSAPSVLPLPPDRDQESWPTPETVIDEDRKKAQEKGEKIEKERKETTSAGTHGKQEWVKVPYTPSVVFNTPLPNAASSRRGGRGGGRGGAQGSGRSAAFGPNGAGHAEKDDTASAALPNGEQTKRGRSDAAVPHDASQKPKRTESAPSPIVKEKVPASTGEKSSKGTEAEAPSRRTSVMGEVSQSGTFPRQYPNRPHKGRRGELPNAGERRRDRDASPLKDHRISATTQTDVPEDAERRTSGLQDAPNGHKQGPGDRRFGSFANTRERTRGGGARGARGASYTNGHQFTNGHPAPVQTSTSFPVGPRSPTTFTPDSAFFSAPQGKYGRNGQRSQSVAADPYRYSPYHTGPPVPHIQTYMGNMYDYNMMQPMSAVSFNPYGVDHVTLFGMLTTQLEYYFSVENLIKDLYLRKHMDSQGFVFLSFIAGFNRIKQLTTDLELIKLVCYQSGNIDYQVGRDGQDRLRPVEKWEQWVLTMGDRDSSAQNDGPDELHMPPMPHPHGFDQSSQPQYPSMHAGSPTGPLAFGNEGPYQPMNGFHPGPPQDAPLRPEDGPNGTTSEGLNGLVAPHEPAGENSTKAVSSEPDSFPDEMMTGLTVIVRKQDYKSAPPGESEKKVGGESLSTNGSSSSQCSLQSNAQGEPRMDWRLSRLATAIVPDRLYWIKNKDLPVESIPPGTTHESYCHLRFKSLKQRYNSSLGNTRYDMDVLYNFWSHFLLRNFNTRMYDEFRHFALEDATLNMTDGGLKKLIRFYGESLFWKHRPIRERVAQDYVNLVRSETEHCRPAFKQLQSALRDGAMDCQTRKRIEMFLDADLKASLA